MTPTAPDIQATTREDWTDFRCPCGATRDGSGYDREPDIQSWLHLHKPHSSGFYAESSDESWSKFFASRPPDRRWEIA